MAPDRAAATIDDSTAAGEIVDDDVIVESVDLLLSKDGGRRWQPKGSGA